MRRHPWFWRGELFARPGGFKRRERSAKENRSEWERKRERERERERRAGGLFSQYFRSHEDKPTPRREKKLLKTYVHPKTRNNATTSARRAVGSLDVLRSYRNPCFKHVSWTSLYRFQRSEIREKKSV